MTWVKGFRYPYYYTVNDDTPMETHSSQGHKTKLSFLNSILGGQFHDVYACIQLFEQLDVSVSGVLECLMCLFICKYLVSTVHLKGNRQCTWSMKCLCVASWRSISWLSRCSRRVIRNSFCLLMSVAKMREPSCCSMSCLLSWGRQTNELYFTCYKFHTPCLPFNSQMILFFLVKDIHVKTKSKVTWNPFITLSSKTCYWVIISC